MKRRNYIYDTDKLDKTEYPEDIFQYKQICYHDDGDIIAALDKEDDLIVRDNFTAELIDGKLVVESNVLKRSHKNLMVIEAGHVYCLRHNIDEETFIDGVFMSEDFHSEENSEFDNMCKDLRSYRYNENYKLTELTESEYDLCVEKYGSQ